MDIKCIIIDDEPLAIEVIKNHLSQFSDIELIATFQNPVAALEILKTRAVDLIFLDIEMPIINGVAFVKTLQRPPKIIFTTAYRNYAIESYELDVVDYLLKPISFPRFFKALEKYRGLKVQHHEPPTTDSDTLRNDHIYVNANKKYVKILFDNILYVESLKDYVRIHTSQDRVVTKDSLSEFEKKLPAHFLRVHRSYIVNQKVISAFTAIDIEIGSTEIPIGASYKTAVLEKLKASSK